MTAATMTADAPPITAARLQVMIGTLARADDGEAGTGARPASITASPSRAAIRVAHSGHDIA